ncbi:MAG: glutathione-dependent formaldehyde-activating [Candidatus Binatus sp.]|jgi:hypothetical protein|nr:glutathione-dependent formaldehyde-activating [Candidatus Binatus sp.]
MAASIVGGCHCKAVRYEATGAPVMAANCYCRDCQYISGGTFAPVILVPKEAFKVTKGALKHYEVVADSGNNVTRGFCANCGSPVMSELFSMPFIAIKAGSLDDPSAFKPTANIFTASAPPWLAPIPGLANFERNPS